MRSGLLLGQLVSLVEPHGTELAMFYQSNTLLTLHPGGYLGINLWPAVDFLNDRYPVSSCLGDCLVIWLGVCLRVAIRFRAAAITTVSRLWRVARVSDRTCRWHICVHAPQEVFWVSGDTTSR